MENWKEKKLSVYQRKLNNTEKKSVYFFLRSLAQYSDYSELKKVKRDLAFLRFTLWVCA